MSFANAEVATPESTGEFVQRYTKFKDGDTEVRIMSEHVEGLIAWEDGKPTRVSKEDAKDAPEGAKPFWAMVVYNYDEKAIQIMELTQKTIMEALIKLAKNKKWGEPVDAYDITISRETDPKGYKDKYTGEYREKISYTVTPGPGKGDEAQEALKDTFVDISAIFSGDNPFEDPFEKTSGFVIPASE